MLDRASELEELGLTRTVTYDWVKLGIAVTALKLAVLGGPKSRV